MGVKFAIFVRKIRDQGRERTNYIQKERISRLDRSQSTENCSLSYVMFFNKVANKHETKVPKFFVLIL